MWIFYVILTLAIGCMGALAQPVQFAGQTLRPVIETKTLPSGRLGLPVWFLPELGIEVSNQKEQLLLSYKGQKIRYMPQTGWENQAGWPAPELFNNSLHLPLDILTALGVPMQLSEQALNFPEVRLSTVPSNTATAAILPADSAAAPLVLTVRHNVERQNQQEMSRVVLNLPDEIDFELEKTSGRVTIRLPNVQAKPQNTEIPGQGLVRSRILPQKDNSTLWVLDTQVRAETRVFTLENPFRIVIDTTLSIDANPPLLGVQKRDLGALHLLIFDPRMYAPKVVSAPYGEARSVEQYVKQAGAIAGVNGGYFDVASRLPVDLVASDGQMVSASREQRATVGFSDQNVLWGVPKPRYQLQWAEQTLTVNTISAKPNPAWLTFFPGDGQTSVGAEGFVTLVLQENSIAQRYTRAVVVPKGLMSVTFDGSKYSTIPQQIGVPLRLSLNWSSGWENTQEALAAGPMLLQKGQYVLNPKAEGFNTAGSIWRPTRQVAFGTMENGAYVMAFLEWGTPEVFAKSLQKAGVHNAMRLDSGTSAAVYYRNRYLDARSSRPVPNAIVMMSKGRIAQAAPDAMGTVASTR